MIVTNDIEKLINNYTRIQCSNQYCKESIVNIREILLLILNTDDIIDFKYIGEHRLNPNSIHIRAVYAIVHSSYRTQEISFTGMSTVQVFSNKIRTRSTHCYYKEFKRRLNNFLKK